MVVLAALPSLGAGGETPEAPPESWSQLWFFRFLVNAAGYASFMVPGYLMVQYFRRKNYLETGRGLCFPLVKTCVFGNEPKASEEVPLASRTEPAETTPTWQALKLLFCAAGLQVGRQGGSTTLPGLGPCGQRLHGSRVFILPVPRLSWLVCYVTPSSQRHTVPSSS